MRRFRHQDARTRSRRAPAMAARIASRPHSSPCAPALGDIATAGMPVSVVSQFINSEISSSAPCVVGLRRQGMQIAEAGQPRHLLVQARIVLHGAGAERIKPGVDGVIHARQAHIMADHFRLAEARQADRRPCGAGRRAASSAICTSGRSTPVTPSRPSSKISAFFMIEAAVAGDGRQFVRVDRCPARWGGPDCSWSSQHLLQAPWRRRRKSSSVLVSVAATISRSRARLVMRHQARGGHAGDHALRRQRIDHRRGGLGQLERELVEEGRRHQRPRPCSVASRSASADALA